MSSPEFGEQQQTPMAWDDFINAQLEGGAVDLPPVHGHPDDTSKLEGDVSAPEVVLGEPVIDVRTLASSQRSQLDPGIRVNLLPHLANEGTILRGTFSLQATQHGYYPFISADTTIIYDDNRMDTEPLLKLPVAVEPHSQTLDNEVVQAAAAKRGMLRFLADVQIGRDETGQHIVAMVRSVYAAESHYAGAGDTLPWPGDSVIMQGQVTQYNPGTKYDSRDPGSIVVYNPEMGEQTIDTQPVGPLNFSHDIRADRTVNHLHNAPKQGDTVQVRAFRTQEGNWSISPNQLGFVQKSKQVEVIRLVAPGDESVFSSLEQYDAFATQMAELRQATTPAEARTLHAALMRQAVNSDKYARRQQPYVLTPDQLAQLQDFAQSFDTGTADHQRSMAMRRELAENHEDIFETVLEVETALKKDILGMTFTEFAQAVEDYAGGNYDVDPSEAAHSARIMDLARTLSPNLYGASMFTFYGRGIPTILDRTPNIGPGTGTISAADGQVLRQLLADPEPRMRLYEGGTYNARINARRLGAYSQILGDLSNESLQAHGLDSLIARRMNSLLKEPFKQAYHQGPPRMEDFAVVKDRRLLQVVQDLAPGIIARLRQNVDNKPLPDNPQHPMHEAIMKQRQQVEHLENAMILIQQRQ